MSGAPVDVIERLPEWRGADCKELGGGLTNRVWRLEKDGRRAVLKVDEEGRRPPLNSRESEAAVQSVAAQAGLAGRVLYVDEHVLLSEYVDGSVRDGDILRERDNLRRLGGALHRLHALPLTKRVFDPAAAAMQYINAIQTPRDSLVQLCLDVIRDRQHPTILCCCHNDLVAQNIVATRELRFIDWEYACDNDPMFDLATTIEHHDLCPAEAEILLDAYANGETDASQERLIAQRRLYLVLLWLWQASRPGSSALELDRIGQRLVTSCS